MPEIEDRIAALPIWSGLPDLAPLPGGISNPSFIATDDTGRYAVRVLRDFPFHNVVRDRELTIARAAHAAGFAPEIVHAGSGLMVSRFIEGDVLAAAGVIRNIPRIAEFLRRFHREMADRLPEVAFTFQVFDINRGYVQHLLDAGEAVDARRWLRLNTSLEALQQPVPRVFGHHDLLPANLIDDGRRLWLIDYEYAGFGTAMFDLANLSSNSSFDAAAASLLLETYFDGPPTESILRAHAAMEAASLLREALWSLVSIPHLDRPGVDYRAYAAANFTRLEDTLARLRKQYAVTL